MIVNCPNRCPGQLLWVDDQWYCPVCRDEWSDETIAAGIDVAESDLRNANDGILS